MTKKILWTIAVIILTLYLFFWHSYVRPFDFSDFFEAINFFSTLLTALIFASVLTFLTAFIPLKQQKYRTKLTFLFPINIVLVCFVFGLSFYSSGPHYYAIKSEAVDCKSVKDGLFQIDNLLIERKGDTQIQTNIATKEKEEFFVRWLSDCEYELTSMAGILKVKIVSVDKNGYDCYVWSWGRTSKRLKVIRQNNAY